MKFTEEKRPGIGDILTANTVNKTTSNQDFPALPQNKNTPLQLPDDSPTKLETIMMAVMDLIKEQNQTMMAMMHSINLSNKQNQTNQMGQQSQ